MVHDYIILMFIFGIILYYEIISEYVIGIIILYVLYTVYIQNKTEIYDNVNNMIKRDEISEYVEKHDNIKRIYNYKKYDKQSFLKGLKKYKRLLKYLDKLDEGKHNKENKNILENCKYYLDESINHFLTICNQVYDVEENKKFKETIDLYSNEMIDKIKEKQYDYGLIKEIDII